MSCVLICEDYSRGRAMFELVLLVCELQQNKSPNINHPVRLLISKKKKKKEGKI